MHCTLEKKEIQEIKSTNTLQQTSFWAKVKYRQGLKPVAYNIKASSDLLSPHKEENQSVQEDILVFIRYVSDNHCIAYIPYGPKMEPVYENYGIFIEELSEALKSQLPENCILIRYDIPWENQYANEDDLYNENGQWEGPPSVKNQEFRLNFNTNNWNLFKSPSDILPTNTFFLNLNQSKERLLQNMKSKTRYNIRLSQRKGVVVKECGLNELDSWYELYKNTSIRNNITLHSKDYFYSVLAQQQKDVPEDIQIRLLIASHEGENLAAMFLGLSKNRGTYLYGASSSTKRNFMASYAMQWEAIKIAKEAGCQEYDMFGAAPNANSGHPLNGLYRFKSGFGGNLYHRMGCWDYPLQKKEYNTFKAHEVNNQKYHIN